MKTKLIGKEINNFAKSINDLPSYFGDSYFPPNEYNRRKVNGEFVAKKYNAIINIIIETKATVNVYPEVIKIKYKTGEIKICRDVLTDSFLLPAININYGFHSIN